MDSGKSQYAMHTTLWRNPLSRKKKMFTEAFSTIDHSLLIENLSGYSSSVDSLKCILVIYRTGNKEQSLRIDIAPGKKS